MERTIKPIYGTLKIIGVLFVLILIIASYGIYRNKNISGQMTPAMRQRIQTAQKRDEARMACWSGLKRQLHDPASAEAVNRDRWPVTGRYTVLMVIRSRNLFGALQRQSWRCEARDEGERWRILILEPAD